VVFFTLPFQTHHEFAFEKAKASEISSSQVRAIKASPVSPEQQTH